MDPNSNSNNGANEPIIDTNAFFTGQVTPVEPPVPQPNNDNNGVDNGNSNGNNPLSSSPTNGNQNQPNQPNDNQPNNNNNGNNPDENVVTFESTVADFLNPNATEDILNTKTNLLGIFKADNIDDKGNLLNDKNEIVISSDKLKNYLENDVLPLDKDGNFVNDKGEVLATKEDLLRQDSVIEELRVSLVNDLGLDLPYNPELPETTEGIVKLVQTALQTKETNIIKGFLETDPRLKSFYQHLALGGQPENFVNTNIDYKSINIKNLDANSKLDLIARSFKEQGNPNPKDLLDLINKGGDELINQQAGIAIKYLDAKQAQENSAREAKLIEQGRIAQEENQKYWGAVKETITKGSLDKINIPLNQRDAFFNYLATPVNEYGDSAANIDAEKDSLEFELMINFLRFNKGNLSVLVNNIAKQDRVNNIKDKLNKIQGKTETGVQRTGSGVNSKADGTNPLSLEHVLGLK